jgi:hypothetical protein
LALNQFYIIILSYLSAMRLRTFVSRYLSEELRVIRTSRRNNSLPELNSCEKALIYYYSEDGFEEVNERLRNSNGQDLSEFGNLLKQTLKKLSNYTGLVFRNVNLTQNQIEKYEIALKNNLAIAEFTFTSCSRSKLVANQYGGNVMFRMFSKTGKNIESVAKYGLYDPPNEKEVIFVPNTEFFDLAIESKINYLEITLEEK